MKLFLFLVNVFSIFGLIFGQIYSLEEECEVYYSLIGDNDGTCCTDNIGGVVEINLSDYKPITVYYGSRCENGHITNM